MLRVDPVYEGGSSYIWGVLRDGAGVARGTSVVTALTFTLTKMSTGEVVNGWDGTDILNKAGGTLDVNGNFSLTLNDADHTRLDPEAADEWHVGIVKWVWGASDLVGFARVEYHVVPLPEVVTPP